MEVVRFSQLPETMAMLKQEEFDIALIDSSLEDVENICFRITWLSRIPVVLVIRSTQTDSSELRSLDVAAFVSEKSGSRELAAVLETLARDRSSNLANIKVLIIEDDTHIREALRLCFRIYWPEAEVSFIAEGEQGIKLAKSQPMDIILLDLGLPDMSGFEVLGKIRSFSQTPVVMLTAHRDQEEIVRAIKSGANDYLVKPFRQVDLMTRIKKYAIQGPPKK